MGPLRKAKATSALASRATADRCWGVISGFVIICILMRLRRTVTLLRFMPSAGAYAVSAAGAFTVC